MTTISLYYLDILNFLNSLTIKFNHQSIYMDNNIAKIYNPHSNEVEESKYYKNLNGELHSIDTPIITSVTDIEKEIVINKENIRDFPLFFEELSKFGKTFNDIVRKYPTQALYLRGIMNPVDIETAKAAEDGTILYYNKDLVDINELSFIKELEDFIKRFLYRHNVPGYNLDEYYQPSLFSNLFSALPTYIVALRLKKVLSFEASGHDIYNYLASYKYIDKNTLNFLDRKSLLYLYGELGRLKTNIGSNETLNDVITELYGANGVGVGTLKFYKKTPEVLETRINTPELELTNNQFIFKNQPANKAFKFDRSDYKTYDVVDMESQLGLVREDDRVRVVNNTDIKLDLVNKDSLLTKVFMFDKDEVKIFYNTTMLTIILNTLIYKLKDDRLVVDKYFINPTDGIRYRLDKESMFYTIIKAITVVLEEDPEVIKVKDYKFGHVFNPDIDVEKLIKNSLHKEFIRKFIVTVKEDMDKVSDIKNTLSFNKYILTLRDTLIKMWYLIANVDDIALSADLKVVYEAMFISGVVIEDNDKTINEILRDSFTKDLPIDVSQGTNTLIHICKDIFDLDIDEVSIIRERYKRYVSLIKKFKSYTVQFIHDDDFENMLNPYTTSLSVGQKHVIVGNINEACFKRYVEDKRVFKAKTTPFRDIVIHSVDGYDMGVRVSSRHTLGVFNDSITDVSMSPVMLINTVDLPEVWRPELKIVPGIVETGITVTDIASIGVTTDSKYLEVLTDLGITEQPVNIIRLDKE